jgi:hypothetical protein
MKKMFQQKELSMLLMLLISVSSVCASMNVGTNFWNIGWHKKTDCFKDGWDNVNPNDTNPWNPQFLKEIEPYCCFRFMDWGGTNGSTQTKWSDRTPKSSQRQRPVSYEWMIDLCNKVKKDMWVCIPHLVVSRTGVEGGSNHYVRKLAVLVKTGIDMGSVDLNAAAFANLSSMTRQQLIDAGGTATCDSLDERLRFYVEYSNETWNGSFAQSRYCSVEGSAVGLHPIPSGKTAEENWTAGFKFHSWAAIRIFREAEKVFGADNPRVVKVDAQQNSGSWQTSRHIEVYESTEFNPNQIYPTAFSVAPYFGNGKDGSSATIVQELRDDIAARAAKVSEIKTRVDQATIDHGRDYYLVAYEGGPHVVTNADAINTSPAIYNLVTEYLDTMSRYFRIFSYYCHVGGCGERNCWGAIQYTGQPIEDAHKYRALVDWIRDNGQITALRICPEAIMPFSRQATSTKILHIAPSVYAPAIQEAQYNALGRRLTGLSNNMQILINAGTPEFK